jgi:hypothetical protein
MSLPAVRQWARTIAALLLLATAARLPHLAADDAACLPAAVGEHDETQHGFQPGAAVEDDHCAVCHWSRSLRSLRAPLTEAAAHVTPRAIVAHSDEVAATSASIEQLPARAPPSAL